MTAAEHKSTLSQALSSLSSHVSKHFQTHVDDIFHLASHLLVSEKLTVFSSWEQASQMVLNKSRLRIEWINYRGTADDQLAEYAEIKNNTLFPHDLSHWQLNAGNKGQDFTFPEGFMLLPGDSVKVYTNHPSAFSFKSKHPIWNNQGDSGYLFDDNHDLISTYHYGHQAHLALNLQDIIFDGNEKYTEGDECVVLKNHSHARVDISGWRINAGASQTFHFPENTVIDAFDQVNVYTNRPNARHPTSFSFDHSTAIWRNQGDIGYLYDHNDERVFSWAYGDKAVEDIAVSELCFDGKVAKTESDEYIELANNGTHIMDISAWQIDAGAGVQFTFPAKSHIAPKSRIRVYTNEHHADSGGYTFNRKKAIWNNQGGKATLRDYLGKAALLYRY